MQLFCTYSISQINPYVIQLTTSVPDSGWCLLEDVIIHLFPILHSFLFTVIASLFDQRMRDIIDMRHTFALHAVSDARA